MFSHVMVGSNDIGKSKKFYDALFGALGGKPAIEDPKGRLIYIHNGSMFLVTPPIDGKPACHANGGTIGFAVTSTEQADADAHHDDWEQRFVRILAEVGFENRPSGLVRHRFSALLGQVGGAAETNQANRSRVRTPLSERPTT